MKRSKLPILVGPFLGEVGFEALYWIPWLAEIRQRLKIAPERFIPIGRGGTALWHDATKAVELYAMRSLQDVRIESWIQTQKTGFHKQYRVTPFERQILKDAAESLGITQYLTLHPSWMYQTLTPFWTMEQGLWWVQQRLAFNALKPPILEGLVLPEKFVAVRFYFRPTFPPSATTLSFCQATVEKIAKSHPVVIITSGVHADDHADVPLKTGPNITRLADVVPMTAENNLAIQSAVIGKAMACVGTYGGMTQYASAIGIPTMAFYEDWHSVALSHRHLSEWMALSRGIPFLVLKIGELPMLQTLLPTAAVVT